MFITPLCVCVCVQIRKHTIGCLTKELAQRNLSQLRLDECGTRSLKFSQRLCTDWSKNCSRIPLRSESITDVLCLWRTMPAMEQYEKCPDRLKTDLFYRFTSWIQAKNQICHLSLYNYILFDHPGLHFLQ